MPPEQKHIGSFIEKANNPPHGNNYLFAIAIDKYEHAPPLSNCVRDAQDFIRILTSKYDFDQKKEGRQLIYTLFDEQATRKNILQKLGELKNQITPDDNFVLFFSGHGETEDDTGFWVPVEARPEEDDEFVSTYDITHRLNAINSFHTFLVVDACFAGSLFSTHKSVKKGYETNPSRWGLAASHSKEVALDGRPGENSPFADRLLKTLRDNNTDLGVQKLSADVIDEVERVTSQKQTPVFQPLNVKGHELGQYVFHLKKDEIADWKVATAKNTVGAFEVFLVTHPDGKFRKEAEANIRGLNAAALWERIEKAPDGDAGEIGEKTALIDEYLQKFTDGEQYRQARELGKELTWKKKFLLAKRDKYSLEEFIEGNPPFFKMEAEKALEVFKKETPIPIPRPPKGGESALGSDSIETSREGSVADGKDSPRGSGGGRGEKPPSRRFVLTEKKPGEPSLTKKIGNWVLLIFILVMASFYLYDFFTGKGKTDDPETMRFQDDDGKYGFHIKDMPLIEPQFDDAADFKNGKAWVKRAHEEFFINEEGNCVEGCPPLYRYRLDGRYGVKNADGKPITPAHYDDVGFFGGGFIAVLREDKWGYVNERGEEAIPLIYDEVDYAEGFDSGQSWVRIGEKEFSIDEKGNRVLPDENTTIREYDRLIKEGEMAYANGEYEKAREIFEKAIGLDVPDKRAAEEGLLKCSRKIDQ